MKNELPMKTMDASANSEFIRGVAAITTAFLEKNSVQPTEIPSLIRKISTELKNAMTGNGDIALAAVETAAQTAVVTDIRKRDLPTVPAVPISESVKPNAIVCLFDGTEKKMLKRYIRAKYGMEEDEYRAYWGLSADYPMVAPNYAEEKSRVAIEQGLGTAKIDKTPRSVRGLEDMSRKVA